MATFTRFILCSSLVVLVLALLLPLLPDDTAAATPHSEHPSSASYMALVLGANGAVGQALVKELVASDRCTRVGLIVRAKSQGKPLHLPVEQGEKLVRIPVDFDAWHDPTILKGYLHEFQQGFTKGFSALGTTSEHIRTAA